MSQVATETTPVSEETTFLKIHKTAIPSKDYSKCPYHQTMFFSKCQIHSIKSNIQVNDKLGMPLPKKLVDRKKIYDEAKAKKKEEKKKEEKSSAFCLIQ
jgi:cbb3-type cytochrome oxidase cytochrome c subunit